MTNSSMRLAPLLFLFAFTFSVAPAQASEETPLPGEAESGMDPEKVLAYRGEAVVTQQEIDAMFSKVAEVDRLVMIRDGAKVDRLIRALLRHKAVAAEARKAEFDSEPLIAARMALAAEQELSDAWMQKITLEAPEADYEVLAREDYLVNPDTYRTEEILDVSHILVGTDSRTEDEAAALADKLSAEIQQDPARFDDLVMEFSDDPAKAENGGRYPEMRRGQMVDEFEETAFALDRPGQISDPVRTDYGYHILRLNSRSGGELIPFEERKEAAIKRARQQYLSEYRMRYLQKITQGPIVFPEGSVEIMAKRHFGEDLELAPDFRE